MEIEPDQIVVDREAHGRCHPFDPRRDFGQHFVRLDFPGPLEPTLPALENGGESDFEGPQGESS